MEVVLIKGRNPIFLPGLVVLFLIGLILFHPPTRLPPLLWLAREWVNPLPWEQDPEFIQVRKRAGLWVLVAVYQASLPDPILQERHNIAKGASYLRGTVVAPGEIFSLNQSIGPRTEERGFKPGPLYINGEIGSAIGGGVCKVASVLFNAVILANLEVVERHPHSMLVPYVPPGQDATISQGTKDFKFKNNTQHPLLIWSHQDDAALSIALYGTKRPPQVTWEHQVLREIPNWTEYIVAPDLPEGEEQVVFEGSKGMEIHSWIVVNEGKGERIDLGKTIYQPAPRVIALGQAPGEEELAQPEE